MSKKINRDIKVRLGGINRVLKPFEFDKLKEQPRRIDNEILLNLMLNSGMRYSEIKRFAKNINKHITDRNQDMWWFRRNDKKIDLPKTATKTGKARSVVLTDAFTEGFYSHIRAKGGLKVPTFQATNQNLRRWAIGAGIDRPHLIGIRTLRKTWESWLVIADKNWGRILSSQGHKDTIALQHYIDLKDFTEEDKREIIERVRSW